MADLQIKAGHLPQLKTALDQLWALPVAPPQPGKYYFAKIAQAVANELPTFQQQKFELLKKHAPKDAKNEPIISVQDLGNGQSSVNVNLNALTPEQRAAYQAEDKALCEALITLPGVPRILTNADLGACPVPQQAYALMLGVILEDKPPPEAV